MKNLWKILLIGGGIFFLMKDQIMEALGIKAEPGECPPGEQWVAGDWGLPGSCQPEGPPATIPPAPAEPPAEEPPEEVPLPAPLPLPRIAQAMVEEAERTSGLNFDQWNYYYTVVTGTPGLFPEVVLAPFDRGTDLVPIMTIEEWAGAMRRHGVNLGRVRRVGIA